MRIPRPSVGKSDLQLTINPSGLIRASAPRGAILAISLMVLALLAAILEMAFAAAEISSRVAQRYRDAVIAAGAARAGLADALSKLQADPDWTAGFNSATLTRSGATYSMTFSGDNPAVPRSTNNLLGASTVTGYGNRSVPPGCACLISVGSYGLATACSKVLIQAGNIPPLLYAVAADGGVSLWNTQIDSFDSSRGSYGSTHQNTGANLRSNATSASAVLVRWFSAVYGNVTVGPGGGASTVANQLFSSITGTISAASTAMMLSAAIPPAGTSLGDRSVSGGSLTLPPGVYGTLQASSAVVKLSGGSYSFTGIYASSSTIHVPDDGDPVYLHCSGSVILNSTTTADDSNLPKQLWLISDEGGGVTLSYPGLAYMEIYAPQSAVTLFGGELFGAVTASSLNAVNAKIHYDNALSRVAGPRGGSVILARWGD